MADLASLSLGDAYVDIMGNTNKLASDLARAQGMVSGFVGGVGKTLVAGIGAAFLTAGGVVAASFKSWMDEERSIFEMSTAFESVGMNAGKMTAKISGLADALMRQTTLTDDSVRAMSTQAAQMGVNEKNMEEFIKAAIGLGKQSGRSPEMIMRPLILASQGYSQIMLRLFPQLRSVASEQERWNMIMQLSKQGMLAASRETNTLSGAFKQLRNAFGEALDSLGKGLFEKSGLNKEIKKVTASVFAIVDALDQGFSTKAFKGFNFEGLGDWISNLLIKFTAMLMTLPDAFRVLKEIFSNPDKLILILGEGMISVGRILLTTIVEGFTALTSLFKALGKILVSVFAEGLANIPILGAKVTGHYGREYLKGLSAEEEFKEVSQKTGFVGTYRPGALNTPEERKEYDAAIRQYLDQFNVLMPEKMKEMREKMYRTGFSEAMDAIPTAMKNTGAVLKEEITRLNALIKTETNVDLLALYHQRVNELTAQYGIESKKVGAAVVAGAAAMGGDGPSAQITGFAEWWNKVQQATAKNKAEEETAANTKELVALAKKQDKYKGPLNYIFAEAY